MRVVQKMLCAALIGVTLSAGSTATLGAQTSITEQETVARVRKALERLPYYGVFDFLAFSYEKGTVTLMGYAYSLGLKQSAERAVKRAPGVDTVVNKIEESPASQNDDELRWRTYYAIYRDPFLSRYAPGGGTLWGHRHRFRSGGLNPMAGSLFPGMEPAGDYPIRIIVRNGRITLLGVVDNEADKQIAGTRAREVPGSFGVENELVVEKGGGKT